MRLGVVVLHKDRYADLAQCMMALGRQSMLPDRVVVCDDSSGELGVVKSIAGFVGARYRDWET